MSADPKIKEPPLPARESGWSDMTRAFWHDLWRSEMAPEFLDVDVHGLHVLAELVQQYWEDPCRELAGEIRLQRQQFGLTPMDRHRLQWEIDRTETAIERNKTRRQTRSKTNASKADPRKLLRMVK